MGRLAHLQQTLPRMVEEFGRVVLVDWSCPQASGTWARSRFASGEVHVLSVPGQPRFHKTRALNAGAKLARQIGADWFLVLDADTVVMPGLRATCERYARPRRFALGDRVGSERLRSLTGVLLVSSRDFEDIGGYDEAFEGYGAEDLEMRCRLILRGGLAIQDLPPHLVHALPHGDDLRTRYYEMSNVAASERRNFSLLRERLRAWTGRELESIPQIQNVLWLHLMHRRPLGRVFTRVRRSRTDSGAKPLATALGVRVGWSRKGPKRG
jgi:GT2 family glycosyltransferase